MFFLDACENETGVLLLGTHYPGHGAPAWNPGIIRRPEFLVGISGSPFMLAFTSFYPGLAGCLREVLKLPVVMIRFGRIVWEKR
jgi:hypothetical protein